MSYSLYKRSGFSFRLSGLRAWTWVLTVVLALALILTLALSLSSCSDDGGEEDGPVTMLVTHGFGEKFMREFAEDVKRDLDIDIDFVYECSSNYTGMVMQDFIHNEVKADIIFTSNKVPNDYLKDCCLDLISSSAVVSHFPYEKLKENMDENGSVYEVPLSARLIGITYNATLMEEMGWELPKTFNDMVDLKKKCDAAGIPFAFTSIVYSGHPFNYLFNIMGSQWLSSVKGDVWIDGFFKGQKSINVFREKADYFRRWVECGLFGELNDSWQNSTLDEFGRRRALFCFTASNNSTGYNGPMVDENGKPTGRMLNDVHKAMPWISEDGSNNCFTVFEGVWVMLNGKLGEKGHEKHLEKVLKVMNHLLDEKYSERIASVDKDIYSVLTYYRNGDDRVFSTFSDEIKRGFLQPWYYSYFKEGTIVKTGSELASYMVNECMKENKKKDELIHHVYYDYNSDATFDSAIGMLRNTLHVDAEDYLCTAEEKIGEEKVAEISAISGALDLQESLGETETVDVALMPYASYKDLQPWKRIAVSNVTLCPGVMQGAYKFIFSPSGGAEVVGIRMTGKEIKEIMKKKFDPSCYFIDKETGESTFDSKKYGPYPYTYVMKGKRILAEGKTYLVAVPQLSLEKDVFEKFEKEGRVVTDAESGQPVTGNITHGITLYFKENPKVNNNNIGWR